MTDKQLFEAAVKRLDQPKKKTGEVKLTATLAECVKVKKEGQR